MSTSMSWQKTNVFSFIFPNSPLLINFKFIVSSGERYLHYRRSWRRRRLPRSGVGLSRAPSGRATGRSSRRSDRTCPRWNTGLGQGPPSTFSHLPEWRPTGLSLRRRRIAGRSYAGFPNGSRWVRRMLPNISQIFRHVPKKTKTWSSYWRQDA